MPGQLGLTTLPMGASPGCQRSPGRSPGVSFMSNGSPAPASFSAGRQADNRCQLLRRLLPCLDRRQFRENEEVVNDAATDGFMSCANESWMTATGSTPLVTFHQALASVRRGLQLLDGLDALTLEGDIAKAQVKEGLRRLEAVSVRDPSQAGAATPSAVPPAFWRADAPELAAADAHAPSSASTRVTPGPRLATTTKRVVASSASSPVGRLGASAGASNDNTPVRETKEELAAARSAASSPQASGTLSWRNATSAAMVQQALAMTEGALAPALNSLIIHIWPRITEYVRSQVYSNIEPAINASLPHMMQGSVKFTKVHFGNSTPSLGPLYVDKKENGDIEVHIGIKFVSDMEMEITAMAVPVGITQFSFEGNLVIVLAPPMATPPFFGGIQVFFPNPPEVGLNFQGAARVANMPGLRGSVRNAVSDGIAGVLVLPRRIAIDLDEEDSVDIVDLSYPDPTHVLRFTLLCGTGLTPADVSLFGTATSDPYVVATLGCKTWTSPTVSKTLNPVWSKEGGEKVMVDFPVHSERQVLSLKVFDYDFASSDDLIGVAQPISVSKVLSVANSGRAGQPELVLLSSGTGDPPTAAGSLQIVSEVLKLTSDQAKARMEGPSTAHLCMKVLGASNLDDDAEFPYKVRLRVLNASEAEVAESPNIAASRDCSPPSRSSSRSSRMRNLKRASSALLGGPQGPDVLAEGYTAASKTNPERKMADALQSVCTVLAERGHALQEIADILDVTKEQVEDFMASSNSQGSFQEAAMQAARQRAVTRPFFGEVLQLLLPAVEDHGVLEISLEDKRHKSLGCVEVPMRRLINAEGFLLQGPFRLYPPNTSGTPRRQNEGTLPEVEGSLWLKWLA